MPRIHPMCAAMATASNRYLSRFPTEFAKAVAVHTEWCDGAKEFCERQVESETVPRAEYDRVVKFNHHLREAVVMAIVERVTSDSKPEPSPPAESSAPVVSTADRLRSFSEQLESGETIKATRIERYDTPDGPMHVRTQTDMKPAESPDDWVTLTDPEHVARKGIDECAYLPNSSKFNNVSFYCFDGRKIGFWPSWTFRCRRKDLPEVPADKPRMRQVTLREYRQGQVSDWTSSGVVSWSLLTGRTAVVEVPE